MKTILLTYIAIVCCASAAEQVSSVVSDDSGQIEPKKVAGFIEWVEPSIREYPPRYKDEQHMKRINLSALLVTSEIRKIDPKSIKDANLLTDLGYILGMGHNIDLPTAPAAKEFFDQAITLAPENKRTNYLYGMFLISTSKWHMESLSYLQKAYALGEKDAQFSIGILLFQKGEKAQALKELESYSEAHPENEHVKDVIKSMKDGTLKINKTEEG